jgi:hypothetical protein
MSKLDDLFKIDENAPVQTPAEPVAPVAPVEGNPVQVTPPAVPPITPAPAPAVPVVTPESNPVFDINNFNKFFESPLKGEAEVREALKRANEFEGISKKYQESELSRKTLEEKNKELSAAQDPLKHFSSKDAYIAEQIRIKRPDLEPSVVAKLISGDTSKLADFDLLAHEALMQNPNIIGGLEGARELIAKRYDIDPEESPEKWERVSRNLMMEARIAAEQRVAQLKSQIPLPTSTTPEEAAAVRAEQVQKIKSSWAPYVNEMSGFDKLTVPGEAGSVILEMEVPKAFRDSLPDYFNAVIEQTGIEATPENLKNVIVARNKDFVYEYLPKILEVYGSNLRSQIEKEYAEKFGNTLPPNNNIAPVPINGDQGGGARQLLAGKRGSSIR